MTRKFLIRTGLVAALVAGIIGGVGATRSEALPDFAACHTVPDVGIAVLCVLHTGDGFSRIVWIRNMNDPYQSDYFVGQFSDGENTLSVADVQYEQLFELAVISAGGPDARALVADFRLKDRDNGGGTVFGVNGVVVNDYNASDYGAIQIYGSQLGHSGGIVWDNGNCAFVYDGAAVAPCALVIVPTVPLIPYLALP